MKILRYDLKDNEHSSLFGENIHKVHRLEVEWLLEDVKRENEIKIGICTYPIPDLNCFLRHLWSEDDTIVMRKTVGHHHASIHRRYDEGGRMGGPKYGVHQVEDLINFIERNRTVHLYHSHWYKREPVPIVITFDRNAPDRKLYTMQKVIPVEFEKGYFGRLADKIRGRR